MSGVSQDCAAILGRISAFLDGELAASDCAAIERHCASCDRCAPVVEGLRRTMGLCRSASAMPLPDAVRQRARDSIRRLLEREP
jgi:anti-sigma factor RsiW